MKRLFLIMLSSSMALAQIPYPKTKTVNQTDDYYGTLIADPYRWLEDDKSAETADWVKEQNKVSDAYFAQIPYRDKIKKRLEEVYNYPKYSAPFKKGQWTYFYKNNGLQNQSVLYRQKTGLPNPEVLIDPNTLSKDGTTRLTGFSLSKNAKYAAVNTSKAGSDWTTVQVMDMNTKKFLSESLEWVKISSIGWQGEGFYYSRYPSPEGSALAEKNENHQVWYHKIGTAQTEDKLIYEDTKNPQKFNIAYTSFDEKYIFLTVSDRGKGLDGNALFFKTAADAEFTPVKGEVGQFSYSVIEAVGDELYIQTNENAPNEKVVKFNTKTGVWKELIAEKTEPLQFVNAAGDKLFVAYLKDVKTQVFVYNFSGKLENEVKLPGLGSAGGFGGEPTDKEVYFTFSSFNYPTSIFKYSIITKQYSLFRKAEVKFKPEDFETKQVFFTSKDGTKVPMFLVFKKGLKLDSKNPTLLYGYGGFNISLNPTFSPTLIPFLEMGGIYASANLRGGSEYGEKWHEQGMKLKKQNVFDDFIAAAEYLKINKYCDTEHLALRGGSNGGLLVGAVINQRPDLAKVAIPQVGVMDMLRFHKFTIGWNWIADYGSADNLTEFKYLLNYSPLHNIKSGTAYPATLITTADHDDRVVPAHSFKYAATLQRTAAPSSQNPLLIKIETNSGHGASNTQKALESAADIYSFIFFNMGKKF
jgi:prolyl oligopeptidase